MESKKINQLATELTPALSDLTIIGDPSTGISKKITLSQMASLFTGTVEEYANLAAFPLVGAADTIYIALDTNVLYRWDTGLTSYVELSPNIINSLVFNDANGFDGTISLVGSVATLTITTALTQGSVGFIGASGALTQDNSNFYWDNSNKRLGINTNAPTTAIDAFGSGIIGRLNGTSTNNSFLGFASAGTNKWSIGNVQSDHRFRIYSEANTAELVSVLQTGEFGIGIANPTTKLHIDGGASALIANLDANVSVAKSISFRSDNSNRINLEVSGTESGSNAGADFFLRAYSDAGALLNTPLTIVRSTGAATFISTVTASNGILIGGAGTRTDSFIPKFSGTTSIENSVIYQSGAGNILIGNTSTDSGNVLQVRKDQASPTRLEISNANASGVTTLIFKDATESKGFLEYTNSSNSLALYNVKSGALVLGTNNTTALTLASNQLATFTSGVIATRLNLNNTGSASRLQVNGINSEPIAYFYNNSGTAGSVPGVSIEAGTSSSDYALSVSSSLGTSYLRVRGDGNIGIGTNTPVAPMEIYKSSVPYLRINDGTRFLNMGVDGTSVFFNTASFYRFLIADGTSEAMRISASGNVGIGVIPSNWNTLTPLQIKNVAIAGYTSGTTHVFYAASNFYYGESGGGDKYITNGAASLYSQSGGNHSWYSAPVNSSGAGAALSFVEKMKLDTNGVLKIGNGQTPDDGKNPGYKNVGIAYNVSADYGEIQALQQGVNVYTLRLNNAGGAVYAGSVRLDTLSDKRMKTDIVPITGALDKIKQLNGKKFHLIDEEEGKMRYGFIAQELEGILDEFVIQTKTKYKDDKTGFEVEDLKSIENWASSWAALLVEAIKELNAKIDAK